MYYTLQKVLKYTIWVKKKRGAVFIAPLKNLKNGGDKLGYSKIKLIILFANCAIIKVKGGIIEIGGGKNVKCA